MPVIYNTSTAFQHEAKVLMYIMKDSNEFTLKTVTLSILQRLSIFYF